MTEKLCERPIFKSKNLVKGSVLKLKSFMTLAPSLPLTGKEMHALSPLSLKKTFVCNKT